MGWFVHARWPHPQLSTTPRNGLTSSTGAFSLPASLHFVKGSHHKTQEMKTVLSPFLPSEPLHYHIEVQIKLKKPSIPKFYGISDLKLQVTIMYSLIFLTVSHMSLPVSLKPND